MLNVPCGVSGRIRIVKENSITGEITHDSEFDNIWTNYGLSVLSGRHNISRTLTNIAPWPTRLHWGSGAHAEPHNAVTGLAAPVGFVGISYYGTDGIVYDSQTCTVTRTRSAIQAARGVSWTLAELGLGYIIPFTNTSTSLYTYSLVKNGAGIPQPLTVSDIEILTIYYTIQVQYPMSLPPQALEVTGIPPTTAEFKLRPDSGQFVQFELSGQSSNSSGKFSGYTSNAFAGGVAGEVDNLNYKGVMTWPISSMNRSTEYFGSQYYAANHLWKLSPPLAKNSTQVLEIEVSWTFTNATPIEIP